MEEQLLNSISKHTQKSQPNAKSSTLNKFNWIENML